MHLGKQWSIGFHRWSSDCFSMPFEYFIGTKCWLLRLGFATVVRHSHYCAVEKVREKDEYESSA